MSGLEQPRNKPSALEWCLIIHPRQRSDLGRALEETTEGFHSGGGGKHVSPQLGCWAAGACWAQKQGEKSYSGVISRQCLLSTASRLLWEVCAIRKRSPHSSGLSTPPITLCATILNPGGAGDTARRDVNNLWPELAAVPPGPWAAELHPGTPGCFGASDFTLLQPGCSTQVCLREGAPYPADKALTFALPSRDRAIILSSNTWKRYY